MTRSKYRSGDEVIPAVPEWVAALAKREFAGDADAEDDAAVAIFIATKTVENSDVVPQQNRLYIPSHFVESNLVGILSPEELAAASLEEVGLLRKQRSAEAKAEAEAESEAGAVEERRRKVAGRPHGGLPVTVYARCGFRFFLQLTCWDGSGGTVLKGEELKLFRAWSRLEKGDKFEIWAFRRGRTGELCFAVGRR